ncbi:MAG: SNF2 helicase associated domain-containing protein [Anaerolineales bacterium]|nr:SNF2 helicase associated domain-containing protein [Anaerolineales bacterium]
MYKLTPETLDEDRLKKSVDSTTLRLGQGLYTMQQVKVLEITEASATCVVQERRNFRVTIKVADNYLYLKCSCQHASRGLICEHEVAAWLAVLDHLRRNVSPAWRAQLARVMDVLPVGEAQTAPAYSYRNNYLLFFSLQMSSYPLWKIVPYQLPINPLSAQFKSAGLNIAPFPGDNEAVYQYIENNTDLVVHLKSPTSTWEAEKCLNCPREGVFLANLLIDRMRLFFQSRPMSLEDILSMIASTNSPIFQGSAANPLQKRLSILNEPGDIYLNLNQTEAGLQIQPMLNLPTGANESEPDSTIDFTEIELIQDDPLWLLADRWIIRLRNKSASHLLQALWENPQVLIPTEQVDEFREKNYLELAKQITLGGDVVAWEGISQTAKPRLYLSDRNGELVAELRFCYADFEFNYDEALPETTIQREAGSWTLQRVHRQSEFEKETYALLSAATYGLKRIPAAPQPGLFRLRSRTHPIDFLLHTLPRLAQQGFEIYGEEKLKTARVNRSTPTISFTVSSGIDWFDVQAVVNFGELEVALKDVRRAMRKQEKFIKLADGTIGEIPEEWFERYRHLFELGEASDATAEHAQSLRLSQIHLGLIDEALIHASGEPRSARTRTDAEFERRRAKLRSLVQQGLQGIPALDLPTSFQGELRPYQKAGYDWLHFLRECQFGGCLADDMGLGKTVQALVYLQSLYENRPGHKPPSQASLLVVPRSLLVNWQREATRFTPALRVQEYFVPNRLKELASFEQTDLVITTYGVMLRDIEFLHGYTFHYAILDESQAIKNPASQTARAARLLKAQHRLVLTGTPIENSTAELWSQFSFLNPGLLGSLDYFKEKFGAPIEKKSDENAAQRLRRTVYPFILRRTKDQVAPELPPRTERILYCDMAPAQRKFYNRTRDFYRGLLLGMLENEGLNTSRMKILEGLLRLRQICNHPRLVDEKYKGDSAKFELLLDTLETLQAENHKALVFSQFVSMLSILREEMDARPMSYAYLDGQTVDRQKQVDAFQTDERLPFFLISLKAGGLGLNLTAADYVIHIDPWWNPAVEMQASDRTHRIGQDKPVFIFKLIARDSVEEKILILQERKRSLVDQIITTEQAFFKNLTEEDISVLFS